MTLKGFRVLVIHLSYLRAYLEFILMRGMFKVNFPESLYHILKFKNVFYYKPLGRNGDFY